MPSNALEGTSNSVGGGGKRARSGSPQATPREKSSASSVGSKTPPPSPSCRASLAKARTGGSSSRTTPHVGLVPPQDDGKKTEVSIWAQVEPFKRRTEAKDFSPSGMLKFITWNVAGLRGLLKKDPLAIQKLLEEEQPDALCLQETKLNLDDSNNRTLGEVPAYRFVDHVCRAKKGYSGTRTYIKESVAVEWKVTFTKGFDRMNSQKKALGHDDGDDEGRVLTTYFAPDDAGGNSFAFALVNTYVANSGMSLERLPYRFQTFDVKMRQHLCHLAESCSTDKADKTPLRGFIWAGDLNVAERDYDRYFAGSYSKMQKCSGFTPEERASFRETLKATNAVDTFRMLYPRAAPAYTFWSARINGRASGLGWRLDYFVLSAALANRVVDCFAMPHVMGSDHCPVQMWLQK